MQPPDPAGAPTPHTRRTGAPGPGEGLVQPLLERDLSVFPEFVVGVMMIRVADFPHACSWGGKPEPGCLAW